MHLLYAKAPRPTMIQIKGRGAISTARRHAFHAGHLRMPEAKVAAWEANRRALLEALESRAHSYL